MDDTYENIDMYFHPLMEINKEFMLGEKILKRVNVKVLTYNIFMRPPLVHNNENDWKDERLMDFVTCLKNYDVICLQEAFDFCNDRKHLLLKLASQSGLFFHSYCETPNFFQKCVVDGGILVISRFPIVETAFLPYSYGILSDSVGYKGCLYAKIQIKDSNLIVFTSHLQATYFNISKYKWDLTVNTRKDQISELCKFIKEVVKTQDLTREDRILIVGDFNVDATNYSKIKEKVGNDIIDEYSYLTNSLNEIGLTFDIFKRFLNYNPVTYGTYERVLTHKEDVGSFLTLDYMFELYLDKADYEQQKENKKLSIIGSSPCVEQFLIEERPYTQLSDHFGLSIELKYEGDTSKTRKASENDQNEEEILETTTGRRDSSIEMMVIN